MTITGGAGRGAYTDVRIYQGFPPDKAPERTGRAAGRTQERIVHDTVRGLMAQRPVGMPIPLQSSTTQKVGLRGIGSYSGVPGLGADAPLQAMLAQQQTSAAAAVGEADTGRKLLYAGLGVVALALVVSALTTPK